MADRTATGLAAATLAMQRRHGFDLVKISPPGTYQAMDLGAVDAWCGGRRGFGAIPYRPLRAQADWERLAETAATGPIVAEAMAAIPLVRYGLTVPRPILQTVFSPIAVAEHLAGRDGLRTMLRDRPVIAHRLLERLTACTLAAIASAAEAGASGIFYVIQQMRRDFFAADAYRPLYLDYDAPCIAALAVLPINLIHIHGKGIHLPPLPLPASCWLHWELIDGNPGLAKMRALGSPMAIGLPAARIADLAAQDGIAPFVADIARRVGDHPAMLTPGCTLPLDLPPDAIDRWQRTARGDAAIALPIAAMAPAVAPPFVVGALKAVVAAARRDILHPGAPHTAQLAFLQRIEQDLRRPLPLGLADLLEGDATELSAALAALPDERLPLAAQGPRLHLLMEPGTPMLDAMGIVRALRGIADVRLLELDPIWWLASPADVPDRVEAGLMDQLPAGEDSVALLGYGAMADIAAWLAQRLEAAGRTVAFLGCLDAEPPGIRRRHHGGIGRFLRRLWLGWTKRALMAGHSGFVTVPMRAAARLGGWTAERALAGSAARAAQASWLCRLAVPGVLDWRFPPCGRIGRDALFDAATLATIAQSIAPALAGPRR